jgi:hypothetical protein
MEQWERFMDSIRKDISRSIAPYIREMLYCLVVDIAGCSFCALLFVLTGIHERYPLLFIAFPAYLFVECFVNYRLVLLSLFERKHNCIVFEKVIVEKKYIESSASGWLWNSAMSKLYPAENNMQRYRLRCRMTNGKKVFYRIAMSSVKAQRIQAVLINLQYGQVDITYLRYSRIVIRINRPTNTQTPTLDIESINRII